MKLSIRKVCAILCGLLLGASIFVFSASSAEAGTTVKTSLCGEDAKTIVRLYRAYFNRTPDVKGLRYWESVYQKSDIETVAYWMSQSQEYKTLWDNVGREKYVEKLLYRNLLRRSPDKAGLRYWSSSVKADKSKIVLYWVQTPELKTKHRVYQAEKCGGPQPPSTTVKKPTTTSAKSVTTLPANTSPATSVKPSTTTTTAPPSITTPPTTTVVPETTTSTETTTETPPVVSQFGSLGNGSSIDLTACDYVVDNAIFQAINSAAAGSTICVQEGDYVDEGKITISADDRSVYTLGQVEVRELLIMADNVTVDGFRLTDTASPTLLYGVATAGDNNTITNMYIDGANVRKGIGCRYRTNCSNSEISHNTITQVESVGIEIFGENNLVTRNNVYDLFRTVPNYDVDAMRFFGSGHEITNNYFHDINEFKSVVTSSGDTPHVDCFQTFTMFESYNPQVNPIETTDVTISGNYCVRVSRQCLLLENNVIDEKNVHDIMFRENYCEVYDSQIVNLKGVDDVTIENNYLGGNPKFHIVNFAKSGAANSRTGDGTVIRNNLMQHNRSWINVTTGPHTNTTIENNTVTQAPSQIVRSTEFQANPLRTYPSSEPLDFVLFPALS